jgi:hypothetical protein
MGGQIHDPTALSQGKRLPSPQYPLGRRLGGAQSRSGRGAEGKRACPGSNSVYSARMRTRDLECAPRGMFGSGIMMLY